MDIVDFEAPNREMRILHLQMLRKASIEAERQEAKVFAIAEFLRDAVYGVVDGVVDGEQLTLSADVRFVMERTAKYTSVFQDADFSMDDQQLREAIQEQRDWFLWLQELLKDSESSYFMWKMIAESIIPHFDFSSIRID